MISIVIPSWNGRHLLEKSIPPLSAQLDGHGEIIVVDNGSTDGTEEWLCRQWPHVKTMHLPANLGFAGGVNAGITAAGSNDVILVNNDTEALDGWFDALRQAAADFPDYHLFASRVLLAEAPDRIDTVGDGFTIAGFGYKKGWLESDGVAFDTPVEVFGASGCAVYIRRDVFRKIGLFDERFFAFGEDLDFSFRARIAGFRVMYVPGARILHAVRATAAPSHTLYWYHRNLLWILIKDLPASLWMLYGPHIIMHMSLVVCRSALRGWLTIYCRSLYEAFRGISVMLRDRKEIQSCRCVPIGELRKFMDAGWLRIHWHLHRSKSRYEQTRRSGQA